MSMQTHTPTHAHTHTLMHTHARTHACTLIHTTEHNYQLRRRTDHSLIRRTYFDDNASELQSDAQLYNGVCRLPLIMRKVSSLLPSQPTLRVCVADIQTDGQTSVHLLCPPHLLWPSRYVTKATAIQKLAQTNLGNQIFNAFLD